MKKSDLPHSRILDARENRAELRKNIAKSGSVSLSLSLNIPGYPKSNTLLFDFFSDILNNLYIYLIANRIPINHKKEIIKTDEAGDFYLVPVSFQHHISDTKKLKQLTETFEENHTLGRLIDIDIFDNKGNPVSSGKEKPCYYCGAFSAVSCMRNHRHSYEEIRNKIFKYITTFFEEQHKEKLIRKISDFAQRSLLYEISISNKPGLVCFEDSGVHRDMNFFTFINSTAALSPFFNEFCALGYQYQGEWENILPKIREIGLRAEKTMFRATDQVNTHKGIIFLFGISLFSISKILSENRSFSDTKFQETVRNIGKNLVKKELSGLENPKTHGEKVYEKYGIEGAGIRREIELGLPSIFQTAIPYFSNHLREETYKDQIQLQKVLLQGLIRIMAINNDSNILHRSNLQTLNYIKKTAKQAITNIVVEKELSDFCKLNNLSPGGSADLLAVSLLLHFIKSEDYEF